MATVLTSDEGRPRLQLSPQRSDGLSKTQKVQGQVLELTKGVRRRMMAGARESITKSAVDDPDIWPCAKSITVAAVEQFLIDLEHEVEIALETVVYQPPDGAHVPGPEGEGRLLAAWYRFRALVLSHYLPYNKSIYGKFKDPLYLLMYGVTLIPVHGLRIVFFSMILIMILKVPEPPDEHQLISFILIFKGMQFLTQGFLYMGKASVSYFTCYSFHKDTLLACIDVVGPGSSAIWGQLLDYLGSVVLVWMAFSALPQSQRALKKPIRSGLQQPLMARDVREVASHTRLRGLLRYDVACFAITILGMCALTVRTSGDLLEYGCPTVALLRSPQFHSNIYWCCTLYSLLSLPFSLFSVPGLQKVLTHSIPTGYNKQGACVTFALAKGKNQPLGAGGGQHQAEGSSLSLAATSAAASWLKTTAKGRMARGGEEYDEYKKGDFARGVWANMTMAFASKPKTEDEHKPEGAQTVAPVELAKPPEAKSLRMPDHFRSKFNRILGKPEDASGVPGSPVHPGLALEVASVRIIPEACEQQDGVTFFCIEALENRSLDSASCDSLRVLRQYMDFATLSARLVAAVARGSADASSVVPPLPQVAPRAKSLAEVESQRQELADWLESVVSDERSQGIWASDLREFFGLQEPAGMGMYSPTPPPRFFQDEHGQEEAGDTEQDGQSMALVPPDPDEKEEKRHFKTFLKGLKPRAAPPSRSLSPASQEGATGRALSPAPPEKSQSTGAGMARWFGAGPTAATPLPPPPTASTSYTPEIEEKSEGAGVDKAQGSGIGRWLTAGGLGAAAAGAGAAAAGAGAGGTATPPEAVPEMLEKPQASTLGRWFGKKKALPAGPSFLDYLGGRGGQYKDLMEGDEEAGLTASAEDCEPSASMHSGTPSRMRDDNVTSTPDHHSKPSVGTPVDASASFATPLALASSKSPSESAGSMQATPFVAQLNDAGMQGSDSKLATPSRPYGKDTPLQDSGSEQITFGSPLVASDLKHAAAGSLIKDTHPKTRSVLASARTDRSTKGPWPAQETPWPATGSESAPSVAWPMKVSSPPTDSSTSAQRTAWPTKGSVWPCQEAKWPTQAPDWPVGKAEHAAAVSDWPSAKPEGARQGSERPARGQERLKQGSEWLAGPTVPSTPASGLEQSRQGQVQERSTQGSEWPVGPTVSSTPASGLEQPRQGPVQECSTQGSEEWPVGPTVPSTPASGLEQPRQGSVQERSKQGSEWPVGPTVPSTPASGLEQPRQGSVQEQPRQGSVQEHSKQGSAWPSGPTGQSTPVAGPEHPRRVSDRPVGKAGSAAPASAWPDGGSQWATQKQEWPSRVAMPEAQSQWPPQIANPWPDKSKQWPAQQPAWPASSVPPSGSLFSAGGAAASSASTLGRAGDGAAAAPAWSASGSAGDRLFVAAGFPQQLAAAAAPAEAASSAADSETARGSNSAAAVSTARAAIKGAIQERLGSDAVLAARAALDERLGGFRQRTAAEASQRLTAKFGLRVPGQGHTQLPEDP
mmetsp:Transcript_57836/g.187949  ORF Transcript_57836/g.187949 Transcript_57836/m.187949 type:complete len:1499 (-) Transcript_57836:322-4818(-)